MKLRIHFGQVEPPREVSWWQPIRSFPTLVLYKNKKWEFVLYKEDDIKQVDYVCYFSEVQTYNPAWHVTEYANIDYMMNNGPGPKCECGAVYTSFPDGHMFFCPKWSKK